MCRLKICKLKWLTICNALRRIFYWQKKRMSSTYILMIKESVVIKRTVKSELNRSNVTEMNTALLLGKSFRDRIKITVQWKDMYPAGKLYKESVILQISVCIWWALSITISFKNICLVLILKVRRPLSCIRKLFSFLLNILFYLALSDIQNKTQFI